MPKDTTSGKKIVKRPGASKPPAKPAPQGKRLTLYPELSPEDAIRKIARAPKK